MPELSNLDLLRSVAVCLVVVSHAMLYSGNGGRAGFAGIAGVCLFFVHTCLVLMGSLERDPHPGRFYIRRVFRIYPLWLLVLGTTLSLRIPTSPKFAPLFAFYRPDFRDLLGNATLLMNVYGYSDVVGASWTLPLEVQMYLFLPIVFAFLRSFRVVWPLLVIDGYLMFYAWRTVPEGAMSLLLCVPYFLPGAMAYLLLKRKQLQRWPGWGFAVYLLVLVAAMTRYGTFERAWWFCLALGLGLPLFRQIETPMVRQVAATVARYSYGIYLTHLWGIYVALHGLAGYPLALRLAALTGVTGALSIAFYHLVERPGIRLGSRLAAKIERGPEPRADERMMRMEPAP